MIDLHSHILPGLDDGAEDIEASLEIARSVVADGIHAIAATPHVRDDWPTTPEQMEAAVEELRTRLREASIPLELLPGGEIALEMLPALDDDARRRFGLGGNPGLVLLEFPYFGWPFTLPSIVSQVGSKGIVPVLAHPERSLEVQQEPERLRPLVEAGAYVQLTAGSIDGSDGQAPSRCAKALLESGLGHLLASDVHGGAIRRASLGSARRALRDELLAAWLTETVPAALLRGAPPPPRPVRAPRRRAWPFG